MTNKRSTKRALLSGVLALFLCVAMLVGTTFAWFTDSVTSANNIIKSGNLDVELYYQVEGETTWTKVDENTNVFKAGALWEPGYTEVVKLKIVNEGSLALKYQLGVNVAAEQGSTNVNGDPFKLSDYIMYGISDTNDSYADRDEAIALVANTATALKTAYASDVTPLAVDNEKVVTMVVYMPTSVGNEANAAKGAVQPEIKLGINLMATQFEAEEDSFGKDYDAGLETAANGISRTLNDGSTVFYYNEESGFGGRVRLTELPANVGSEYTVPADVNDLGGALVGATLDKLTVPAGVENAYKSLEGATIETVVIDDGATTVPNRMFYKANVENIVIPESITTIEENAFAMAGPETLVIPASVTHVGEAAFQHMPNLKSVTFEGDVAIEGYAFRGCAALRTVTLLGEDVTFITSATGKNSCWFCNGESNNPNTSDITFYVENETVAQRVKTAMGAEANNTDVYVDGKLTVKVDSAEKLADKLTTATPGTTIDATGVAMTPANFFEIPAGVTIKGATIAADTYLVMAEGDEDVVLENCEIKHASCGILNIASEANGPDMVFNNCVFRGKVAPNFTENLTGTVRFNNCEFYLGEGSGPDGIGYVNCNGGTAIFTNCTFDYTGGWTMGSNQYVKYNAVNSYGESWATTVILEGCTFINCGTQRYGANSSLTVR